ncbi:hypothetical protein [Spongiimicrobium sp. 3-5]|uniref:hypothetical protein n=1 Tax=Spongiimicrobium sp. 3-5 TaxID=3332596 RepID=UPI00397FCD87
MHITNINRLFCFFLLLICVRVGAQQEEAVEMDNKEQFVEEDARRLALLKSYEAGTVTVDSVCAAWEFAAGAHIGILGFSKEDGNFRIHMGRDVETYVLEKSLGTKLNIEQGRVVLNGPCIKNYEETYDSNFNSTVKIQCTLYFEGNLLVKNACTDITLLAVK